jgi:hypothetical protein
MNAYTFWANNKQMISYFGSVKIKKILRLNWYNLLKLSKKRNRKTV